MVVTFMVPAFIYFAAALIMGTMYKITTADATKYAQENQERMNAAK